MAYLDCMAFKVGSKVSLPFGKTGTVQARLGTTYVVRVYFAKRYFEYEFEESQLSLYKPSPKLANWGDKRPVSDSKGRFIR